MKIIACRPFKENMFGKPAIFDGRAWHLLVVLVQLRLYYRNPPLHPT